MADIPSTAQFNQTGDRFEIVLKEKCSRSVLLLSLLAAAGIGAAVWVILWLIRHGAGIDTPLNQLKLAGVVVATGMAVACFVLIIIPLATRFSYQRVIYDGESLTFVESTNRTTVPLHDIRSVSVRRRTPRALLVRPAQSALRLFAYTVPHALEIAVPDGVLRFFPSSTEAELPWLANLLRSHLGIDDAEQCDVSNELPVAVPSASMPPALKISLLGMGILLPILTMWIGWDGFHSVGWVPVQAIVEKSRYEVRESGKSTHIDAAITYSYDVQFQRFTCDTVGFGWGNDQKIVKRLIEEHPVGSQITAYRNPSNPAEATLIRGQGDVHWLLLVMSWAGLFIAAPLAAVRADGRQAALVRKYRAPMKRKIAGVSELDHGPRWRVPEEVFAHAVRSYRRVTVASSIRVSVACAVLFYLTWWFFAPRLPEFPWSRVTMILAGMVGLLCVAQIGTTLSMRKPGEYSILDAGILTPSGDHPLIRWKWIECFTVEIDPDFPQYRTLVLYRRSSRLTRITLPAEPQAEVIIAAVRAHLPERSPVTKTSPLTRGNCVAGLVFTTLVSIGIGMMLGRQFHIPTGSTAGEFIFPLWMCVGPGSLFACTLPKRRRATRISLAMALNLFSTMIIILTVVIRLTLSLPAR